MKDNTIKKGPFSVITLCGASGGDFGTEATFRISANDKNIDTIGKLNRLIAAAPDMLDALEAIVAARKRGDLDITEWDIVDKAIAKATGK